LPRLGDILVVWDGFTDGYKVMPPIERLELVAKLIQESGIFTTDETYRRIGVIQTQTFAEFNEQMQMLDEDSPLSFDEYKAVVYERHLPDAPAKKKDFVTRYELVTHLKMRVNAQRLLFPLAIIGVVRMMSSIWTLNLLRLSPRVVMSRL